MVSEVAVRNASNLIIGYVKDYGDRKIAQSIRRGYAGYYSYASNITFDDKGRIYCYGDACSELVRNLDRS